MTNLNNKKLKELSDNEIFSKLGLYEDVLVDISNDTDFLKVLYLINSEIKIDCYCKECQKERTFVSPKLNTLNLPAYNSLDITNIKFYGEVIKNSYNLFGRKFICTMNDYHIVSFYFRLSGRTLQKIGQYPSLADIEQNDIKKYNKVLSKNDLRDLNKAVGLHAHGVGAGSFVYLRRIFESLIEKAYNESVSAGTWGDFDFKRIDMKEKIDNLKEYLPKFIYTNTALYGVLSAGIHSLDEEYCKDNFETLKEAIFVILDQEIRRREDIEREARINKNLNRMSSEIGMMNK